MLDFHTEEQCIYTFAPTPAVFPLLQTVSRSERSFSCLVQKFLPVSLLIYTILHCSTCICNASTGRHPVSTSQCAHSYTITAFCCSFPCCTHTCTHAACCNAAMLQCKRCTTGIWASLAKAVLIKSTPKGVVFSFLFFLTGKSSLLAALLGEMEQRCGHMRVQGTMAYVPQHPWILTGTLRYISRNIKHLRVILLPKTGTHGVSGCTCMPWS